MASTPSPPKFVVTVKTLDGVNKEFSPKEETTVQAFKELIASDVGVAAELQRLIFRGRVLQDDKTLQDYNLGGNTIHLVQRLAGSQNTNLQQDSREHPVNRGHGHSPHEDGGNAIIMGTIGHLDIPSGNPTPRRNSAAVRLQVANEMINRASNLLLRLEEEEAEALETARQNSTPASQGSTAEQAAMAAATATMFNAQTGGPAPATGAATTGTRQGQAVNPASVSNNLMSQIANAATAAALVATVSHVPSDNNNSLTTTTASGGRSGSTTPQPPPEAPRVRELATGLQDILALQERLTPFLRLVLNVLRENRLYSSSEAPQFIYDTVSAAIHAVSHSLHALSDITVDFGVAPEARRLRAPASILVEQSTVVRATIPIPMQAGMQMQLPANLQNIVNAAANASFAQGYADHRQQLGGLGGVEIRQIPNPVQVQVPSSATQTSTPATATPPIAIVNPIPVSTSTASSAPSSNASTPTQSPRPPLQPPQQNPFMRHNTGSPTQMQLPDFLFGPGGLLANEMAQQRGEIYDILLSCHSHHLGAQRQPRPQNLNEHLEGLTLGNGNANGISSVNYLDLFLQTLSIVELLHSGIKDFIMGYLLRGRDPKNESHVLTWAKGIAKKLTEWILKSAGNKLERNKDVDLDASLINLISQGLAKFIRLAMESDSPTNFRKSTIRLLEDSAHKFLVIIKATFVLPSATRFLKELLDVILVGSSLALRQDLTLSLGQYMETSVASTGDFIKSKSQVETQPPPPTTPVQVQTPREPSRPVQANAQAGNASRRIISDMDVDIDNDDERLESVPPLLRNVPLSWVDTIRNDMSAQRRMPSQPPFSHGFMTLFPPK